MKKKKITYKNAYSIISTQENERKIIVQAYDCQFNSPTICRFQKEKTKSIIRFDISITVSLSSEYSDFTKLKLEFKINSNEEIIEPHCYKGGSHNIISLVKLLRLIEVSAFSSLSETKTLLNDIFPEISSENRLLYEKPKIVVSGYIREVFNFNKESHRKKYITTFFPPNEVVNLVIRKIAGGPSWKPFLFRPKAINNVNKSVTRDEASIKYKGIDDSTRRSIEPQQDQTSIFRCCIF